MAWYDEALFYHIYPLGLCGAPKTNDGIYEGHCFEELGRWARYLGELGVTGLYIGPLFESGSHGYDTADYRRVDRRLGSNEELRGFVDLCHELGIRVVLDGVFNHTGRDFFAFRDLRQNREASPYRDWYCDVNVWGDTEYHDGFSYANWGGYNLLAKLNLRNEQEWRYHLDTVRFWVREFHIDGIRLDTADVLDFDFMRRLRDLANGIKPDFWLMGEVIHGEYQRWVNAELLHSVTDYPLHKALYSGHNDRNYFEIAHTVNRFLQNGIDPRSLYSFADNHDVERIHTRLQNKRHWLPLHILLFCLPGIPSLYYGSEFGVDGKKERGSDDSLRPALSLEDLLSGDEGCFAPIRALARIYRQEKALALGDYEQLLLTTRQYAFRRGDVLTAVNNDDSPAALRLRCAEGAYRGALHGGEYVSRDGSLELDLGPCDGEILIPEGRDASAFSPLLRQTEPEPPAAPETDFAPAPAPAGMAPEDMSVEQLQAAILERLGRNGPITDRMRREVAENVYRDSLLNWLRSFH